MQDDKQQHIRFYQLLESRITDKLREKFTNVTYNHLVLREMRDAIKEILSGIFNKSERFKISNESLTWLTNQHFKTLSFTDNTGQKQIINDLIIINDYELSELPFNDIELMCNLFEEASFGEQLVIEMKRRTTS
jgi:hypothetical protein